MQVFDIGAHYDSAKIKAQIKAVYDGGGTGWLLWDPNNRYADVKKALEGMPPLSKCNFDSGGLKVKVCRGPTSVDLIFGVCFDRVGRIIINLLVSPSASWRIGG